MKNLTLTLNATDIAHAVKADTYITGQIDKSSDMVKNAALAYNEQAGDETYHQTKLLRTMKGALAKLEAAIAEYVETSNATATITDTLTSISGTFTITISVGDRTSSAFANTLAYLSQEYIVNTMLYYWWQPIKPSLAKDYVAFASDNILDIKRCLAKSAPSETASYDDVSGEVTPVTPTPTPTPTPEPTEPTATTVDITTSPATAAMVGGTLQLSVTTSPSGLPLTWSSSDTTKATVSDSGLVTALAAGTVTITAAFAGDTTYAASSDTFELTISGSSPIIDH